MQEEQTLSEAQLAALARIADEKLAEEEKNRRRREPLKPTYEDMRQTLAKKGIVLQNKLHCWLRLRRHNFPWASNYYAGTPSHGYGMQLCVACGRRKTRTLFGSAYVRIG